MKGSVVLMITVIAVCVLAGVVGFVTGADGSQVKDLIGARKWEAFLKTDTGVENDLVGSRHAVGMPTNFTDYAQEIERVLTTYAVVLSDPKPEVKRIATPAGPMYIHTDSRVVFDPKTDLETVKEAEKKISDFLGDNKRRRAVYEGMKALKGAGEFEEYAELRLDMLKQVEGARDFVRGKLPRIEKAIQTAKTPGVGQGAAGERKELSAEVEAMKRKLISYEEAFTYSMEDAWKLGGELGISSSQ